MRRGLAAITLVASMLAAPAGAQQASDTIRAAIRQPIETLDINYQKTREDLSVLRHLYDTLIYRDPVTFEYKPLLATSWEWVEPTTLEIKLRDDVKFSNGDAFDAKSVKASIDYIIDPKTNFQYFSLVKWIASVEIVDAHTVRIKSHHVKPDAFEYLSLPIYMYHYSTYEGREPGPAPQPIGTGPYVVESWDPGRTLLLRRNPNYFSDVRGKPTIEHVEIRSVPDDATQIAELLAGRLDWMWYVPIDQREPLSQMPNFKVTTAETMRIAYLSMDAAGRTGTAPLKDPRVRRAIAHAIDREAIRANLVGGNTRVIDAPCYPAQVGCDSASAVKYDYNPERAKALLAEAGYAEGFTVDLVGVRFREWSEAISGDLAKVGIQVRLNQLPYAAAITMVHDNRVPLFFNDWGSGSIGDVSAVLPYFFAGSKDDFLQNAEVKKLVEEGGQVMDAAARTALYGQAIKIITEEAAWLPMFTMAVSYATVSDLDCMFDPEEMPKFQRCKWQKTE